MNDFFSGVAASKIGDEDFRQDAAKLAEASSRPDDSNEDWRYSPMGELELEGLQPTLAAPDDVDIDRFDRVVEHRAATATVIDGWVHTIDVDDAWAAKGLKVEVLHGFEGSPLAEPTLFDYWHQAFNPGLLAVDVPSGLAVTEPIVIINHHSGGPRVAFPSIRVSTGSGSQVSVLERQTSTGAGGLTISRQTQEVGDASILEYSTIQELDPTHVLLTRLTGQVGSQATFTGGFAAFGGKYGRVRTDIDLDGRGATGNLVAAYYGDGDQVHDFRTFQHHRGRDTTSDMLFKGSLDDKSGSVYTGMIHIHPDAAGSNAFQTNRNIKLDEDAWAWSVPNLEIENSDVRCSHASTVSPIEQDQQFYLQARAVPPVDADRLLVAGFFEEAINRLPVPAARTEVRRLVREKLGRRES